MLFLVSLPLIYHWVYAFWQWGQNENPLQTEPLYVREDSFCPKNLTISLDVKKSMTNVENML
jgi:hypothetical protein